MRESLFRNHVIDRIKLELLVSNDTLDAVGSGEHGI